VAGVHGALQPVPVIGGIANSQEVHAEYHSLLDLGTARKCTWNTTAVEGGKPSNTTTYRETDRLIITHTLVSHYSIQWLSRHYLHWILWHLQTYIYIIYFVNHYTYTN